MTDQNCIRPQWAPAVSRTQTYAIDDELGHHLNLRTADQGSSPSKDIKTCLCILGGRMERSVVQSSRALHQGSLLCRSSNKLYVSNLHHSTWSRRRRTGKLPAPAARWRGRSPSLLQDSMSAPPSSNNCATSRFPNKVSFLNCPPPPIFSTEMKSIRFSTEQGGEEVVANITLLYSSYIMTDNLPPEGLRPRPRNGEVCSR